MGVASLSDLSKEKFLFDENRNISQLGVSVLQDMKSWIFYPKQIEFQWSEDGVNFGPSLTYNNFPVFEDYVGPTTMDAMIDLGAVKSVKAIKFKVANFGKCPDWHLGSGNDTWLFLDEIIFR